MTGGGPLIGVLSFEDLRVERSWPEAILNRLNMVAQIFANALARKRSDLRLREQLKKIEALRQRLETIPARIGQANGRKHLPAQAEQLSHSRYTGQRLSVEAQP